MENMICNRRENMEEALTPYINKPVYIKGYCWSKDFDGWAVLYLDEKEKRDWLGILNLYFDYKGEKYTVYGFLPHKYTSLTSSTYNNAIYKDEIL